MSAAPTLKSYEFRAEREQTWRELDELLSIIDKRGLRSLSSTQLTRLPHLYRATLSSLSVARSISLDRNTTEYLESLAARAYFCVYSTKRHLRESVRDFVTWRFPAAVRRHKWHLGIAALFLVLGAVTGFAITLGDQDRFYTFVSQDYAQGRGPSASTSELEGALYDDSSVGSALMTFATFLFTHNAKIGIMAFALGFAVGLPVFLLMFMNGLILGAFGALYHGRGLSVDLWGWLLPHGVTELLAVVLCGAAGLILAQSVVFPGRHTRLANLALRGRRAGLIVVGAVVMLFIAGLIEGIFRQTVHSIPIRYTVATATAVAWIAYFGFAGRGRAALEEAERE
jgi:uncharacterized membrane protein SpoIIM required for sporulation